MLIRREAVGERTMISDRRANHESVSPSDPQPDAGQGSQPMGDDATDSAGTAPSIPGGPDPDMDALQTVNSELKTELAAITRSHSDLQNVMAAIDIGILFLDRSLRIRFFTPRITDAFAITIADEGRPITDIAHCLDYPELAADARQVLEDAAPIQREVRSSSERWFEARVSPYRTDDDKIAGAIDGAVLTFLDITDRKLLEARQQLLLSELTHRVKNLLAVVQSIANQTLRTVHSPEDFVDRFAGRLAALAGAHGLLVQSEWRGADFASLVRVQIEALENEGATRILLDGPPLCLPPDLATPVGLVMHELATNAAKYGALSLPAGRVAIGWTLERQDGQPVLAVEWRETGGPPVSKPAAQGFGGVLIEKSIPGAAVQRAFEPDGVVCTIRLPLPSDRSGERRPPH